MKSRINILFSAAIMAMLLIIACSDTKEKIIGVWVVEDVKFDTDTSRISPEQIQNAIQMQKSYHYEIFEDKTMNIVSGSGTFPGKWSLDVEKNEIFVRLDGSELNDSIRIGKFEDGRIINRDKTEAGWVEVIYEKE
ncbi:MAG: hypothetical protein U5Q03_15600 [Bacteroidota bacterium]|nr:hypothetical protein [Bacteroidota bacterium]